MVFIAWLIPLLAALQADHPPERRVAIRVADGLAIDADLQRMAQYGRRQGLVVEVATESAPVPAGAEAVYVSGLPPSPRIRRALARFPASADAKAFTFDGRSYRGPEDALLLSDPARPAEKYVLGTSSTAVLRALRGVWRGRADADFLVVSGDLVRDGKFRRGSNPLSVEPGSGRDQIAAREEFFRSLETIEAEGARWHFRPGDRTAVERLRPVLKRYRRGGGPVLEIRIFPDAVTKGRYTGSSRPADVSRDGERVRVDVDASAPPSPDLVTPALAGAALAAELPRLSERPVLLLAAGARACGQWWGRDVAAMAALLREARVEATPEQIAASDPDVSPIFSVGSAAWWLESGAKTEGEAAVRRLLEGGNAELLSALKRWASHPPPAAVPPPRRALPSGFLRGLSYAMSNSIDSSYASPRSRETLSRLSRLSVNSVSIMPFGWTRDATRPALSFVHRHPAGETDEGTVRAVADARALGMSAMVKPQIWVPGVFVGDLAMESDADWSRWFDLYRQFIVHHAIVSEAAGAAIFCVGTELAGTEAQAARWRQTIAAVRLATGAPLVYAANWAAGAPKVPFWDALDAIGVDFYDSLSPEASASDAVLAAGVRAAVRPLEPLARRTGKPVLFCEAGYPPVKGAWITPHDESSARAHDGQDAARAIAVVFRTLGGQPWWKGVYWWKAFSSGERARPGDRDFNVLGTPAERAIAEGFDRIARDTARR